MMVKTSEIKNLSRQDLLKMRHFLTWVGITGGIVLGGIAAANFIIDPFDWNTRRLLPQIEADFALHDREVRLNLISRRRPDVLVVGNSVSQHAFSSSNAALHNSGFMNASVGGGSLREMALMLGYAQSQAKVKRVIAGIDFSFTLSPKTDSIDWLLVRTNGFQGLNNHIGMLLSAATFYSSARTVLKALEHVPHLYGEDEHSLPVAFERNVASQGGYAAAARETLSEYTFRKAPDLEGFSAQYKQMLKTACSGETTPIVVILPKHAAYMEMVYLTGNWSTFVAWEENLVAISEHADCPVELWDFTGYTPVTTDPVPILPTDHPMHWFYELLHFKGDVGDMILNTIYNKTRATETPAQFGTRLTSHNVVSHLEALNRMHKAFEASHPEVTAYVLNIMQHS